MSDNQIKVGRNQACYSASGTRVLRYTVEMSHEGLNEHKLISAPDTYMLNTKVNLQKRKWNEKWETISSRRKINNEKEANLEEANRRTDEAMNALKNVEDILASSLSVNHEVDWESLRRKKNTPNKYLSNQFES